MSINKVTYMMSNLFTLKQYKDGNLNCQSFKYPTLYGIRCAILGSVVQVDGVEKAKELFYKIKNAIIYVQYPNKFKVNGIKLKRYRNTYYELKDDEKHDRDKLVKSNFYTTMGFRQYYDIPQIIFYIDNSIPNLELYLKNIDWLGTAESMVYLDKIEQVNSLNNVLVKWNKIDDEYIYPQHDWSTKTKFENVYMYSNKYKHIHDSFMCTVKDIAIGGVSI